MTWTDEKRERARQTFREQFYNGWPSPSLSEDDMLDRINREGGFPVRIHRNGQTLDLRRQPSRFPPFAIKGQKPVERIERLPILCPPRIYRIIQAVALEYGLKAEDLATRDRKDHTAYAARCEAMFRLRHSPDKAGNVPTLQQIGKWFGRDHATVKYAIANHIKRTGRAGEAA